MYFSSVPSAAHFILVDLMTILGAECTFCRLLFLAPSQYLYAFRHWTSFFFCHERESPFCTAILLFKCLGKI